MRTELPPEVTKIIKISSISRSICKVGRWTFNYKALFARILRYVHQSFNSLMFYYSCLRSNRWKANFNSVQLDFASSKLMARFGFDEDDSGGKKKSKRGGGG